MGGYIKEVGKKSATILTPTDDYEREALKKAKINSTARDVARAAAENPTYGGGDYIGGEISKAGKSAGGSISNAYHTSVVDPLRKAGEQLKDWLGGGGGGKGGPAGMFNPVNAPTMPGGGGAGGANTVESVADPRTALINQTQQEQFRGMQTNLARQLADKAAGVGPMQSELALKQAQDANLAATMAQMASQRGGASPLIARQAMQTASDINAQTAQQAAQARLAEIQGAQQQLANVAGAGREQDIGLATSQAGLEQQTNMAQFGEANQNARFNAQLGQQFQELQAKYAQMGLSAEQANQLAAIETQKIAAGISAQNKQVAGGVLSTLGGLVGTVYGGAAGGAAGATAGSAVEQNMNDDSETEYGDDYSGDYSADYVQEGKQTGDY